jgi:predicted DNA-binding ribbon-helix-helix protein
MADGVKRSVTIAGHRTSVSLEEPFWEALREIAKARGQSLNKLITEVDAGRAPGTGLSSALRVFVLAHYRSR